MKNVILLSAMILISSVSQAEVMLMTCTTAKGTELKLKYDNYSPVTSKAEIISLSIGGKDMKPQMDGQFGTSGGKPTFRLVNFPSAGQKTSFSLWGPNSKYFVDGKENPINCTAVPEVAKPAPKETSF